MRTTLLYCAFWVDHPRSGVVYNFEGICLSVCLSYCMYVCQTITFESIDVRSLFSHIPHVSTGYGSSSYMKVIGSMSRSRSKKVANACLCTDQRRSAIFIGARRIAPLLGGPALDRRRACLRAFQLSRLNWIGYVRRVVSYIIGFNWVELVLAYMTRLW